MGRNLYPFIKGCFFAGAALVPSAAVAEDSDPVVLMPTSGWHVDYAENSCKLARKFGSEGNDALLILERTTPGDLVKITVLGSAVPSSSIGEVTFATLPHGTPREAVARSIRAGDGANGLILYQVPLTTDGEPQNGRSPTSDLQLAGQVETLLIDKLRLRTGELAGPLRALQGCVDDLLASRGLSPEERVNFAVPKGNPSAWFTSRDLPSSMLKPGVNLTVFFRMDVNLEGEPTGFTVIKGTGNDIFDRTARSVMMKRARFHPILDMDGNPVPGVWVSSVQVAIN